MSTSIVEIRDAAFVYNGVIVLQGVSLDIRQGDFIAMIGPTVVVKRPD